MLSLLFNYRIKALFSFFKGRAGVGKTAAVILVFAAVVFSVVSLCIGIYAAVKGDPERGAPILETMVSLAYHGIFILLLFSGLSLAVFTVYFGKDLELLFSLPIEPKTVFLYKFLEALILNVRMAALLLAPSIILLGLFYQASLWYYIIAAAVTYFMASIPGSLGIIISSLFIQKVSRARMKNLAAIFGSLLGIGIWAGVVATTKAIDTDTGPITVPDFPAAGIVSSPLFKFLPSGWASKAAFNSALGNWREVLIPLLLLGFFSAVFTYFAMRLTERHYGRGLIEDSEDASPVAAIRSTIGGSPLAAHIKRDLILIYRQPQVLMQIMMLALFMLLFPFIARDHQPGVMGNLPVSAALGILAMMLGSQLGSCLFPLERQGFYRNLMIPGGVRVVLLEKFILGLAAMIICSIFIGSIHLAAGKASGFDYIICLAAFSLAGLGFGLPIGLIYADFAWEHPKRMLKGGGTFILIAVTLVLGAIIYVAAVFLGKYISSLILLSALTVIALIFSMIISLVKLANFEWTG